MEKLHFESGNLPWGFVEGSGDTEDDKKMLLEKGNLDNYRAERGDGYLFQKDSQFSKLFGRVKHLQAVKSLADPFQLLFSSIFQKTYIFPIMAMLGIVGVYEERKKYREALKLCQVVLPHVAGTNGIAANVTYTAMGRCLCELGDYKLSLEYLKDALDCRETRWTNYTRSWLLIVHQRAKKLKEGQEFFQRLLTRDLERYGEKSEKTFETKKYLIRALCKNNNHEEALSLIHDITPLARKLFGAGSREELGMLYRLGIELNHLLHYEESEHALRAYLAVEKTSSKKVISAWYTIGENLLEQRKLEEAESQFRETASLLARHKNHGGGLAQLLHQTQLKLGHTLFKARQHNDALSHFKTALAGFQEAKGPPSRECLHTLEWIVLTLQQMENYEAMLEWATELASANEKAFGADSPYTIRFRKHVSDAVEGMKKAG